MALKYPYQIKTVIGAGAFALSADANESFMVKDIRVYNPASAHITVKVGRKTVGYLRVSGSMGNHLSFAQGHAQHAHDWTTGSTAAGDVSLFVGLEDAAAAEVAAEMIGTLAVDTTYPQVGGLSLAPRPNGKTLLRYLYEKEIWRGIPVATGESLIITGAAQSGAIVVVEYEIHDAGDIAPTLPNGSESKELDYINYGNTGATVAAAGDALLDTQVNPAEFPKFPFGDDVPANATIEVHGILASDLVIGEHDGTDGTYTEYLKLFKDQDVLFDEDRKGLLVYGGSQATAMVVDRVAQGQSVVGNYSDRDYREPWHPPEPIICGPGDELDAYWTYAIDGAGKNVLIADQEVGFILRQIRS